MCIVLCLNIVRITMCLVFVTISCHTSPSMRHHVYDVVDESLQNVPQHYYILDTLTPSIYSS